MHLLLLIGKSLKYNFNYTDFSKFVLSWNVTHPLDFGGIFFSIQKSLRKYYKKENKVEIISLVADIIYFV